MIENVPEEIQDFLELALEGLAGGTIRSFKPDKQLGGILVTFDQREGMYYADDCAISECRVGNGFAPNSYILLFCTTSKWLLYGRRHAALDPPWWSSHPRTNLDRCCFTSVSDPLSYSLGYHYNRLVISQRS
jgi:hypothetical protein